MLESNQAASFNRSMLRERRQGADIEHARPITLTGGEAKGEARIRIGV